MEHVMVAIRPGQGPGALAWALDYARATPSALEVIASGLESRDPRALLLVAGEQLRAAHAAVPCAMRPVSSSLAQALAESRSIDLFVVGSSGAAAKGGRLPRAEAFALLRAAAAAPCPTVIVPGSWTPADDRAHVVPWTPGERGETRELLDEVRRGAHPIRVVPTSFAPPALGGLSALGARNGRRDDGPMTAHEDRALELRIRSALDESVDLDALAVEVEASDGSIRLSGEVGSFAERLEAVELAAGVVGPDQIKNDITVRATGEGWRIPDHEVAEKVRNAVASAIGDDGEVEVEVEGHVVRLHGHVPSPTVRAQARHAAASVAGVDFVEIDVNIGDVAT